MARLVLEQAVILDCNNVRPHHGAESLPRRRFGAEIDD